MERIPKTWELERFEFYCCIPAILGSFFQYLRSSYIRGLYLQIRRFYAVNNRIKTLRSRLEVNHYLLLEFCTLFRKHLDSVFLIIIHLGQVSILILTNVFIYISNLIQLNPKWAIERIYQMSFWQFFNRFYDIILKYQYLRK